MPTIFTIWWWCKFVLQYNMNIPIWCCCCENRHTKNRMRVLKRNCNVFACYSSTSSLHIVCCCPNLQAGRQRSVLAHQYISPHDCGSWNHHHFMEHIYWKALIAGIITLYTNPWAYYTHRMASYSHRHISRARKASRGDYAKNIGKRWAFVCFFRFNKSMYIYILCIARQHVMWIIIW